MNASTHLTNGSLRAATRDAAPDEAIGSGATRNPAPWEIPAGFLVGSPAPDERVAHRQPAARASLWHDDRPSAFGSRRDLRRASAGSVSRRRSRVGDRRARPGLDAIRRRVPLPARPADAEHLGASCVRTGTPPPFATPGLILGPTPHRRFRLLRRAGLGGSIKRTGARQSPPMTATPSALKRGHHSAIAPLASARSRRP